MHCEMQRPKGAAVYEANIIQSVCERLLYLAQTLSLGFALRVWGCEVSAFVYRVKFNGPIRIYSIVAMTIR